MTRRSRHWSAAWMVITLLAFVRPTAAQVSTGAIAGLVSDPSGAGVPGAEVTVTSRQTGVERVAVTSDDGRYAVAILPPGAYSVRGRHTPLTSAVLSTIVQAGQTSTVDVPLDAPATAEVVTVSAAALLRGDHHQLTGWVDRAEIERQPLNGRNVLETAKVEPGVPIPARVSGGRVFIAPLGAGLPAIPRVGFTRVTVDGANIETPGTVGTVLQISPDAVDQVQVSTANFDVSTGLATSGAVDVVTRSGGNQYRASAFTLYRDRQWAASPAIPGAGGSTPSFRRHHAGGTLSGPLRINRAFFFAGYERHDQRDAVVLPSFDPDLKALAGQFISPTSGTLLTGRIDMNLAGGHQVSLRHLHDANLTVAPVEGTIILPSGWSRRPIRAHQTLVSATSVLGVNLVSDLRVSYYATSVANEPLGSSDCALPCLGFGAPRILLSDGGPRSMVLGAAFPGANRGWRLQVSDGVVWQHGPHLTRAGIDWESTGNEIVNTDSDPVQITLWAPAVVRQRDPSIALPTSFATVDDLLALPLRSFTTSVGPSAVLQRGFQPVRRTHTVRMHAGNRWQVGSRLTLNGGLAWSYEPGVLNDDLRKPDWLEPLVGVGGLQPPRSYANWSGTVGLAWSPTGDRRTVVRAGVGRYVESMARTVALNLANERALLSPLGTSRLMVSGANLTKDGLRLNFPQPTSFTGRDLLAILPEIRSSLATALSPDNRDFSLVTLDVTKEGRNLYDSSYATPRAVHATAGLERDLGGSTIVSADVVWKRFTHTFINGIDYNRFFSAAGPVIPACTTVQRTEALTTCSNGSLFFDTTSGRARYLGLLVRAERRLARGSQVLVSYTLGSFVGTNGTGAGTTETPDGRVFGFNNDDWFENYGPLPTDVRHLVNVSAFAALPWRLTLALNWSAMSRPPFSAHVAGMDFNGDGTTNDLLPGTRVNQFNRGLGPDDLVRLVARYNAEYAGRLTAGGQLAPEVTLPDHFAFNDRFSAVDLRVTRTLPMSASWRLSMFLDVFNVLNTMNGTSYSGNLAAPAAFGQPAARVGQAFGSGGPRAAQLGLRVSY